MATVRKRKWTHNGVEKEAWVVTYTDQGGKRRQGGTFEKKKDADRERLRIETEIEKGVHIASSQTVTMLEAGRLWVDDCWKRHRAIGVPQRSTIVTYEAMLRVHIIPAFGAKLVSDIESEEIADFLITSSGKLAYWTVKTLRTVMSGVLQFCVRTKRLKRNIMKDEGVKTPGSSTRIKVPSRDQIETLLKAMEVRGRSEKTLPFLQRRVLVLLALFGGMRVGEICGLTWDKWDQKSRTIKIRHSYSVLNGFKGPKTEAGERDIGLSETTNQALVDLWNLLGQPTSGFVLLTINGRNMRYSYYTALWQPLMHRAGLSSPPPERNRYGQPAFHFHALRHAAVSLLIEAGVRPLAIAPFVGHKNVNTTMGVYGHLFPDDDSVRTAVTAIGASMAPALAPPRPPVRGGRPLARTRQQSDNAPQHLVK